MDVEKTMEFILNMQAKHAESVHQHDRWLRKHEKSLGEQEQRRREHDWWLREHKRSIARHDKEMAGIRGELTRAVQILGTHADRLSTQRQRMDTQEQRFLAFLKRFDNFLRGQGRNGGGPKA